MARIEKNSDFVNTLAQLPLKQQRELSARFISDVLHLAQNPRLDQIADMLRQSECTDDNLHTAFSVAQSVYVETSPGSDIAELKMDCQATHFIAQALMMCSAPVKHADGPLHLAQKVANYCRMAKACSGMGADVEGPDFSSAEAAYKKLAKEQFEIVNQYLAAHGA